MKSHKLLIKKSQKWLSSNKSY